MRLCVYEQLEVHRVVIHMMLVQIPKGKLGMSVLVEVEECGRLHRRGRGSQWSSATDETRQHAM